MKEPGQQKVLKRLFSVDEAAQYLSVSPWTIRDMGADGKLPIVRVGRRVLFDGQDLDRFVDEAKRRE